MKRWMVILGVLALVLLGVSAVGAQDEPTPPEGGRGRPGVAALRELMQIVSDETGLLPREIAQQVREGSTLAQVIEANGGSVQTVTDAAVAAATEALDRAVANGRITQERADEVLTNLPSLLERAFNGELERGDFGRGRPQRGPVERRIERGVLQMAADATGLTPVEIRDQLQAGATLADVLTQNGVDPTTFVADVTANFQERLSGLVEDGTITQERADELLENFQTRLTERLNNSAPAEPSVQGV